MKLKGTDLIGLFCKECKQHTLKSVKYLRRRIKAGKSEFYCDRNCADKAHAKRMKGEGNPNYEGEFHGIQMRDRTPEERKEIGKKISYTMKANGTSAGRNNSRWAGGEKPYDCVICGKEKLFRPYEQRNIESGKQSPTCSPQCALALGRRNIKTERTSIEIKMADELGVRGIKYIEQYNLGDKFRLDFLLPEYGIVVECDGDYWHTKPEVAKRDKSKNAYIKACGFSLYRFWEREINADVEACVDIVLAEINAREAV